MMRGQLFLAAALALAASGSGNATPWQADPVEAANSLDRDHDRWKRERERARLAIDAANLKRMRKAARNLRGRK